MAGTNLAAWWPDPHKKRKDDLPLYLEAEVRLYEAGKIVKDYCNNFGLKGGCPAPDLIIGVCARCPLNGLGTKLMKESGCFETTGEGGMRG